MEVGSAATSYSGSPGFSHLPDTCGYVACLSMVQRDGLAGILPWVYSHLPLSVPRIGSHPHDPDQDKVITKDERTRMNWLSNKSKNTITCYSKTFLTSIVTECF